MRKTILATAAIPALALSLAACGHHVKADTAAHAVATSTPAQYADQQARQVWDKCGPAKNALTELEWVRSITAQKGVTARHAFLVCANNGQQVTTAEETAFGNEVEAQGSQVLQNYARDETAAIGATDTAKAADKSAAKAAVKNFAENTVPHDAVTVTR